MNISMIISIIALVTSIVSAVISGIVGFFSIRNNSRHIEINNIKNFLKDVCIGMLEIEFIETSTIDSIISYDVKLKDINDYHNKIRERIKKTDFYDGARAFLGDMYKMETDNKYRDDNEHKRPFYDRINDYGFEGGWNFLFNKFRRYEKLVGIKKSALS
ncbi:MAG: hypothetical protein AB1742_15755 [bacterium]